MINTQIKVSKKPRLKSPILVEGLPGVGLVGRLAAEQLINETKAEQFAVMTSPHFPPQVMIDEKGIITMFENSFHYWKNKKGKNDLVIMMGDHQGLTVESQHEMAQSTVDLAKKLGVKEVYTLAGFSTGNISKKPKVYGAATTPQMVKKLEKNGVIFQGGPTLIAGAAGLLPGIGARNGLKGACLMAETHGAYADPTAAEKVLETLAKTINIKVSCKGLGEMAKDVDSELARIQKAQSEQEKKMKKLHEGGVKDKMGYFG